MCVPPHTLQSLCDVTLPNVSDAGPVWTAAVQAAVQGRGQRLVQAL